MIGSPKKRALFACCSLAVGFTGFSVRLVDLQVSQHDKYSERAAEQHGLRQSIFARRGAILDLSGQPLAQNEPVRTVVADGTLIKDPERLAAFLAGPLQMPEKAVLEKLSRARWSEKEQKNVPSAYIVLRNRLPEADADRLTHAIADVNAKADKERELRRQKKATPAPAAGASPSTPTPADAPKDEGEEAIKLADAGLRAITFEQDFVRVYPNGETLCHVIGFVDGSNKAVEGIERTMDSYLKGHEGVRFSERDRHGKELVPYRGPDHPAHDGANVRLTIDLRLQDIVEEELAAACKQYKPKFAVSIIMRPQTGEILAMANRPNFDLSNLEKIDMDSRRNRAVTDMVEPGSIFKIGTWSGALNEHLVTPSTMINCENGSFTFMGRVLKDTHPAAELSVHDGLVHSSNICAAKLGIQLGEKRLYEYVRKFGFGDRTGVQLPGESGGLVHPLRDWTGLSISRVPMGQEVCVTPLQMATAMCVIANGGTLMMPQIVHDVTDADGSTIATFPPVQVRPVISSQTASEVRDALVDVMGKHGTAKNVFVPGFTAAGKTGTAQIATRGGYEKNKYLLSFVGFVPAENPQFVCLVMIDEAQVERTKNYGGQVSGPVFAKIAERTARYLGMKPSAELLAAQQKANPNEEHIND